VTWKTVSVFALGVCAALALGIWIGPSAQSHLASVTDPGVYDMAPMSTPPGHDDPASDGAAAQEYRAAVVPYRPARPATRTAETTQETGASSSRRAETPREVAATDNRQDGVDASHGVDPTPADVATVNTAIDAPGMHTGVLISPALARHVKPLLRSGANVTVAADGFRSAAEFVTVARAAQNTGVPFMLLKHRVISEGRSLAKAIESSKPELNGSREAGRAAAQARVDMAAYVVS